MNSQAVPILLVIDQPSDWGLYMPQLIDLARARNADVHVLETGESFKPSAFIPNTSLERSASLGRSASLERDVQPVNTTMNEVAASVETPRTTAFLEELVAYIQDAGIRAKGEWQPECDRTQLGPYADTIGARTIAVIDHGFPINVLLSAYVNLLESEGFEVVRLQPISAKELNYSHGDAVGTAES